MARAARLQERRTRAYELALDHAYRIEAWVARTEPIISFEGDPGPPEPIPDEALFRLNALSSAHASADVQDLARAMTRAAQHFQSRAFMVRAQRQHPTGDGSKRWQELEAARAAYREALAAFGNQINAELAS
jgi:hypothetical protein